MEVRMRSLLNITFAAVILTAVVLSVAAPPAALSKEEKVPVAYIEEKVVDVGQIYEEKDVEHEFIIENRGNAELHILRIKAG
jgi:hypothetical protein